MRIDVAVKTLGLVLVTACGGATGTTNGPHGPPAGEDPCHHYIIAMQPPLVRMTSAADRFEDSVEQGADATATSARDLAAVIERERKDLVGLRPGRADLADEHAKLVAALGELASSYRGLADGLAARAGTEAARVKLRTAEEHFDQSVTRIREICPGTGP